MHCNHCVSKVFDALTALEGVVFADVDLKTNSATLKTYKNVTEHDICLVIEKVGFFVKEIVKKQL